MKVYKTGTTAYIEHKGTFYSKEVLDWDAFLNRPNLHRTLSDEIDSWNKTNDSFLRQTKLDPPLGSQEIWAAGVTYERSKSARMDEAKASGGAIFYDKVYDAERPELFFKSSARRCVGHGEEVFIRRDSSWNVPEPELTLFVNSNGNIEGYTIGNDMSSRSIEGENPLYLPQAKTYEKSAAIGPCLLVLENQIPSTTEIHIQIARKDQIMYEENVAISKIKRGFDELVGFLFRECDFPDGVFLMTGTCLVPPDEFSLAVGDLISISIDQIGTLVNHVAVKSNI